MKNIDYYNHSVQSGYYDMVFKKNKGIQSAWHHIKFNYIKKKISNSKIHLDVGCGPGTFFGNFKKNQLVLIYQLVKLIMQKKIIQVKKLSFIVIKTSYQ